MAGVSVLLGEPPEARDTCLRVGHLQQHSPGPAGSGEVTDTHEVAGVWHQGKCGDFRELALSRESLPSSCKKLPGEN